MRWVVASEPEALAGGRAWVWTLSKGRRSKRVQVGVATEVTEHLASAALESRGLTLLRPHLTDLEPPDRIELSPGHDAYGRPLAGPMALTNLRGWRGRVILLAHRLDLPHWLHPRG